MVTRGFTIVELIITITIMGILLVLAVVNVNASQIAARDDERQADIESIASHLESYYIYGNFEANIDPGSYPSTAMSGASNAVIISNSLRDMDIRSILAPGISDQSFKTLISATNTQQNITGVTPLPDKDHYVYQPLKADGSLCTLVTEACRKFNLFYFQEADSSVVMVTSKNQ